MSSSPSRRSFIQTSAALAALSASGPLFAQSKPGAPTNPAPGGTGAASVPKKPATQPAKKEPKKTRIEGLSPGDKVNVAVIGCGGRGGNHLSGWMGLSDHVNVVAVCDPDESHTAKFVQTMEEEGGGAPAPQTFTDLRKMFDKIPEIQAVSIATPNHWHTLAAIYAIQAGKDVYCEKPCSHTVVEGRRLVQFARKHNKIVQHGTQSRSARAMWQAIQFIHSGGLGKIYLARGTCYKRRDSIGLVETPLPVPKDVDYDIWCGPASMDPIMRKQFHYDWHWFWHYGNGDIGNQGVHQMDICLWGLNKHELPKSVQTIGGRFGYKDSAETPNTELTVFDYDDCQAIFEVRGLPTKPPPGAKQGVANIFYGTEGTLVVNDYGSCTAYAPDGEKIEMPKVEDDSNGNHFTTFIKAVHTRKLPYDRGEIEAGHYAAGMCHLANISYRVGKPAKFDGASKAFGDDKAAYATVMRTLEHLKENKVPLDDTEYMLGPALTFDTKSEKFTGDNAAAAN